MGKVRPGNKQNAGLNGEWATHVRKAWKKFTSGIRRSKSNKEIKDGIDHHQSRFDEDTD